jgi:hypothetical protein
VDIVKAGSLMLAIRAISQITVFILSLLIVHLTHHLFLSHRLAHFISHRLHVLLNLFSQDLLRLSVKLMLYCELMSHLSRRFTVMY